MNKVGNLTLKNIIPFKNITYPFNSANKTQGRIQRLRPTARRGTSELEELKEERKRELLNDEAPIESNNNIKNYKFFENKINYSSEC